MSQHGWRVGQIIGNLVCECGAELGPEDRIHELINPSKCPLGEVQALSEEFSPAERPDEEEPVKEQKSNPEIMFGLRVIELGRRLEVLESHYVGDVDPCLNRLGSRITVLEKWMGRVKG